MLWLAVSRIVVAETMIRFRDWTNFLFFSSPGSFLLLHWCIGDKQEGCKVALLEHYYCSTSICSNDESRLPFVRFDSAIDSIGERMPVMTLGLPTSNSESAKNNYL